MFDLVLLKYEQIYFEVLLTSDQDADNISWNISKGLAKSFKSKQILLPKIKKKQKMPKLKSKTRLKENIVMCNTKS